MKQLGRFNKKVKIVAVLVVGLSFAYLQAQQLNLGLLKLFSYTNTGLSKIMLANQYQLLADLNRASALQYFNEGLAQYKSQLTSSTGLERGRIEYALGLSYQCGPTPNLEQAAYWFRRAAMSGIPLAAEMINELKTSPQCRPPLVENYPTVEFIDS